MNIEQLRAAIPEVIRPYVKPGIDPVLAPEAWALQRGSTSGYLAIIDAGAPDGAAEPFVHVKFMIMKVPASGEAAFLRRLLELNHDLGNFAGFSVDTHDRVWLGAGRFAADLEPAELSELISQTARLSDRFDDQLLEAFGRENALD